MKARSILLVEDSGDDETLILRTLRKHNLANEVMVVRDGAEALDYLFATGPFAGRPADQDPQVLVLDLKLPKIPGLEVLRRVRAAPRTALLPVVVLTSSDEDLDLKESYRLGANSYVRKPVDFGEFTEAVARLGMYWLMVAEVPPTNACAS